MTLVTGAELFTGNTALVTAAVMEGKTTKKDLAKNWIASYAGNFVGSLFLAYLAFKSGTLANAPASVAIATAKCSLVSLLDMYDAYHKSYLSFQHSTNRTYYNRIAF